MNYETAIELAHQRMREIGKAPGQYHIDVYSTVGTPDERAQGMISFTAYNEYLYLINYERYFGLIILSDSAIFHADDHSFDTKSQEFTGDIKIFRLPEKSWSIDGTGGSIAILGPQIPVDFLRVIIH